MEEGAARPTAVHQAQNLKTGRKKERKRERQKNPTQLSE